ncbi:MAG: Gfo/Idh/MocA family oxidoreductase [Planctomycetes bacterium]|nr:Gfo/Idh/MocA family oxidoreductase [Planctomycetota bacterium]
MTKTYRVGIIGRTGKGNYGHGLDTVWAEIANVEVVAVADDNEAGRADAAKRTRAKQAYADYREMLDKEKLDIVAVAPRWLDCHRDMVVEAAEHGCHMFMEKPMCRTLAEADEMVETCERHHVKLAIAHQTRYSPRLDRVRELIAEGRIGDVLELRGRGKEDSRAGGEDMMVLGTHIMDLIRFLAGDPKWRFARVLQGGKPVSMAEVRQGTEGIGPLAGDSITAMYGLSGTTTAYFATVKPQQGPGGRFGLQVFGSKGVIDLMTGGLPPVMLLEDPAWAPGRSKKEWVPITSEGVGKPEPLKDGGLPMGNRFIVQDLIQAIEQDRQPRGSVYDGRAALEMILATYESHRVGGAVALPLKLRQHPLTLLA